MLKITEIQLNHQKENCMTDEKPEIRFSLCSDRQGESLKKAVYFSNDWRVETSEQINVIYGGSLTPFSTYEVHVEATGESGEVAKKSVQFRTGRMNSSWVGQWITDNSYSFPKGESPVPMTFRKMFSAKGVIRRAWCCVTAMGIYEVHLNGRRVGEDYFAPGFTSYEEQLQYQLYDITEFLREGQNTIQMTIAGGWAVGSMFHKRVSQLASERQKLLAEIYLEYEDGNIEIIGTDETWGVTEDGPVKMAEWYDGETYDATYDEATAEWKQADMTNLKKNPKILLQYGEPVRIIEEIRPVNCKRAASGEIIYDFGQNFAGVIAIKVKNAREHQKLVFRHAEVLKDGELFTQSLRTAKATVTYFCKQGEQFYSPHFTYMGFRYVGMQGIEPENIEMCAYVLHSKIEEVGSFTCSDSKLNRLYENIRWSGKSNFVEIPTDCPQRDERLGWTGDIAVFSSTAVTMFDMSRFLGKWLLDVVKQQGKGGGFPVVIPKQGMEYTLAVSCWGDCCIMVPWAEYLARGDIRLLKRQYPAMKKYLKACAFWAGLFSIRKSRKHIWRYGFHFGDWCAPGGNVKDWMKKGKWTATAYYANSCNIVSKVAEILGKYEDAEYYHRLYKEISISYRKEFTNGNGDLLDEFQTGYVLPLHFQMVEEKEAKRMADNLVKLIRKNQGCLSTGFPGTPYILFALSDNGYLDEAYQLLFQEKCPGWLYEINAGATTLWERWDALRPDGTIQLGRLDGKENTDEKHSGMVSFNHYAYGAVGDWFYKRILGIEPIIGGYKEFKISPKPGGGLIYASGCIKSPYGKIVCHWKSTDSDFYLDVEIPVSTSCELSLPNGEECRIQSGRYSFSCKI